MIQIEKLQKVIDGRVVLEIDSLAVAAGEMAALVGAPGSGKGELLALLTGRLGPTSGQVRLAGVDPAAARSTIGDIVLGRKGEGIVAYFLASAFDDADQDITHVIRGEDLFDFTPIQVILQHLFDLPTPI